MSPERFHDLVQAYGADLRRWPAAEREGAARLLNTEPALHLALAEAAQLDALLDAHSLPAPDPALTRRVLASAPAAAARPLGWWAGAGFAAIGLAGSLAGALGVSLLLQTLPPHTEALPGGTAFSQAPTEGSDE